MKKHGTAMKYMPKLLISTIIIILNQSIIHAETLHDMLSIAYKNDVNFRIIESQFESKVNDTTPALRAFLPKIDLKFSTQFNSETSVMDFTPPTIQYHMNLFHGFSDVVGLKILQNATLAETARYHVQEQKEFAELIKNYLDVIVTKEKCSIIEGNLNLLKKQLNLIKSRYNVGHATLIDVAIIESQLVGAEANLHRSRIEYSNACMTFETRFGAPVPESMEFPEISQDVLQDLYTKDLASVAQSSNFDLLQNDYINRAKQAQITQAELNRLPKIDSTISHSIPTSSAIYQGGIALTWTLFNGGISDKARGARIDARSSAYNFGLIEKFTQKTVNLSLQNLSSLEKSLKYTELLLKSQQLIVDSLNKKFLLANVDLDKILDAESRLNSTKQELWNIKSKFIIAFYDLQSLMGQLTAKGLKLDVKYYDPESEIQTLKRKIFTTL